MRVAIVGAGSRADDYVRCTRSRGGARLVGIADADPARARRHVGGAGVEQSFASVAELLRESRPDVVHVVARAHPGTADVAEVLEAGCHATVEQPLALDAREAEALFALADRHGVRLCPIHARVFESCLRRADGLVTGGRIGGLVKVDIDEGLDTRDRAFRDYPQPNVLPWMYGLPGGVYQAFLPDPLAVLLEYTGPARSVTVQRRAHGALPQGLPDEVCVLVDGERASGTVTLSFASRPPLRVLRLHGASGVVEVDFGTKGTAVHALGERPAAESRSSSVLHLVRHGAGRSKARHGLMRQVHAWYDALERSGPPPVSREQALAVLRVLDEVLAQLHVTPLRFRPLPAVRVTAPGAPTVLVTGGTGFLGKALVARLVADGHHVRVLARKLSRVEPVHDLGADVVWGDVADEASFDEAVAGCDTVVHLAAGTSGSERDSETGTLQGTRHVLELCRRHGTRRLVYISSCSVYGVADYPANAVVPETAPLERFPDRRGSYSKSKLEAERDVTRAMEAGEVAAVVLRPGTIYGPSGDLFSGLLGFALGSLYVVIGRGQFVLPYVYVDNLVDAVVLAMQKDEAVGRTFNVVDPEILTKRTYMDRVIRRVDPGARVFYLPYAVLYGMTWLQERIFGLMGRRPLLSLYRLASSQKSVQYDCRSIAAELGWAPGVSLADALDRLVAHERGRNGGPFPRTAASGPGAVASSGAGSFPAGPGASRPALFR